MSSQWHARRAKNLCGRCGATPEEGRAQCLPCSTITATNNLARWRKQNPNAGTYSKGEYLNAKDKEMLKVGRCRCGLLLPCGSCLPATAAEWRTYAGGPVQE